MQPPKHVANVALAPPQTTSNCLALVWSVEEVSPALASKKTAIDRLAVNREGYQTLLPAPWHFTLGSLLYSWSQSGPQNVFSNAKLRLIKRSIPFDWFKSKEEADSISRPDLPWTWKRFQIVCWRCLSASNPLFGLRSAPAPKTCRYIT